MTMRKKIFISNTTMVLISLLILFGIGGFALLLFKEEFMRIIEQNAELSDHIYEVQTVLMEEQEDPNGWIKLSQKLKTYGFELYVSDENKKVQYSNVRHSEEECIEELEKNNFTYQGVKVYSMENVSIARCYVTVNGSTYMVYATYYPKDLSLFGMDRGVFEMFIIVFIGAGIIIIAGLLLCSQIFTKMMIKRIMRPVDELNRAAIRINEGNFDEPILYEEDDEFMEVCRTFNDMQQHLKESIEQSRAYEKARTEMISGISHDLRTPLTSVKGFIKGMLDGIANTPEKQQRYLEISYRKACDMEVLLQKLFFFSKLETGNMPFFPQKVNMGEWIERYAQENETKIEVKKEEGTYFVMIDPMQMKRVFDNIIENSKKYADVEDLKMVMELKKERDLITMKIKDNGKGIKEEKLPHVFEQFYRGDEARNSKNDGSGLGLYVCKYIIEEQKGTIQAYNENGFCIEISLPEGKEE